MGTWKASSPTISLPTIVFARAFSAESASLEMATINLRPRHLDRSSAASAQVSTMNQAIYSVRLFDRNGNAIGAYFLSLNSDDDAKPEADKVLREYGCERVEVWARDTLVYAAERRAT